MNKLYGHGDVIVKQIKEIPEGLKVKKTTEGFNVLAYGEITGHAHCLVSDKTIVFEDGEKMYLKCTEEVELKHQKLDGTQAQDAHQTITLPKGDYQIGIVKEFDYFTGESRNVAD